MSALWLREARENADERLSGPLCMRPVWRNPATEGGRLLYFLLLRLGAVSADTGGPTPSRALALTKTEAQAEEPAGERNARAERENDDADDARRLEVAGLDIFELEHG
jgi:hypothetical protein